LVGVDVSRRRAQHTRLIAIAAALLTAAGAACERNAAGRAAEPVCPDYATTALSVRVADARTGAGVAKGAVLSLRYGGGEPETHAFGADDEIYAVFGEAGRYDARVTKPGYRPWEQKHIMRPDLDGCGHTSPADVVARMEPNP
jgi:hypothetical protein